MGSKSTFWVLFLWLNLHPHFSIAQPGGVTQITLSQFKLQSSNVITESGNEISSSSYEPSLYWFPVRVPSTVLSGLVANGVYPNPYIGMNNMLIPDASDSFNHQYHLEGYSHLPNDPNPWKKPYWYRTVFKVPLTDKGKHFQLIFKGINYRAEVWLNGTRLADSTEMAGMFAEYSLDASRQIKAGSVNVMAVKIYPLDYPGLPSPPQLKAMGDFFANGGPTGDIGKNVTMLCSAGWDWMPAVRDRNMGIWQPIFLRTSGQVTFANPQIKTTLPGLPDTATAAISIKLSLNNSSNITQKGMLQVAISPENFKGVPLSITRQVSLAANESKETNLDPSELQELIIRKPHLWWPNGYGQPNLYRVRLKYSIDGMISDDTSFVFGIRTVDSKVVMVNGWARRDFYVNGKRISLTGGAWVPDMMLNRDSLRYAYELHLCHNANINLVRIWGGGVTPPDVFYDLADRYGLLVWQDFWITGDTQGTFKGSPDWPLEGTIFIRNMVSTILRIRNHPSLLVWTGGNEGHARKELYDAMRYEIVALDGSRPFISSSSGFDPLPQGWKGSWPDDGPAGVYSGGPYSWQDAAHYYKLIDEGKDWVFKDETGIPSQPPYETLPRIINNLVPDSRLPFPLNNTWGYHDACVGNAFYNTYYDTMKRRYGVPVSMKDFSDKMQLINFNSYRGIFEATAHKLNETGGVLLWKLNAAFPSVVWQVYDWFLNPNAGYYSMQRACEPIHIQLNLDDSVVAIVNRNYKAWSGMVAQVNLFSLRGDLLYSQQQTVSAPAASVLKTIPLASILSGEKEKGISFVVLSLRSRQGKRISHNVYWVAPSNDFKELKDMPHAEMSTRVLNTKKNQSETTWTFRFTNRSGCVAFFLNPKITIEGKEILPGFWSDNYFSLPPNQSTTVSVSVPHQKIAGEKPTLFLSGYNVSQSKISLP